MARPAIRRVSCSRLPLSGNKSGHDALDPLGESSARLELAATLADLGVWSVDLRTRTSSHDERLRAMVALDDQDDTRPATALWLERIHPDERASARRSFLELISGDSDSQTLRGEYRIVWPDGSIRWIAAAARLLVDEDDKPSRVVGVAQDITRWRRAREERQRWADVFQHTAQGVLITDARTELIIDANPAFGRMTGYSPSELRGRPLAHLYAPSALHQLGPAVRKVHDHGRVLLETTYARQDGTQLPVFVDATVVTDADGEPLYRIANVRDLSMERRIRDRQLLLVHAGELLASSLDYAATIRQVVSLAVPAFADLATFSEPERPTGALRTTALQHAEPAQRAIAVDLSDRYPMHVSDRVGAGRVLRTGEPELLATLTDETLEAIARDDEHLMMLREVGLRSMINVPLVARGEILGVLGFMICRTDRQYDEDDLRFALELAHRAALAVDNTRLFAAERAARERTERLQWVTAGLTEALTSAQAADVIIREAVPMVHGRAGIVFIHDEASDEMVLLSHSGLPAQLVKRLHRFRPAPGSVAAHLLTGSYPMLAGPAAWEENHLPDVAAAARASKLDFFVAFPFVREGRPNAVLSLFFDAPRTLTADELDFIHAVIAQGSQAMERARLFETAERERRRAERTAELARRIQQVTAALSVAVTPNQVARTLVRQGSAAVRADGGVLAVLADEGDHMVLVYTAGVDTKTMQPHQRIPCLRGRPLPDAVMQRRIIAIQSPDDARNQYPDNPGVLSEMDAQAMMVVPVLTGEHVMAVLALRFAEAREITTETRDFLSTLGEVAGQALERARLYAAESGARAEAERARQEAEAANAAKSDFLAVMSHELRTPLNAIAGYTELLELGVRGPVTAGQLDDLGRIQRSQRHLLGLINDVLNFARLDAGRVEYHMERVPVAELIVHAREIIEPQTLARDITFRASSTEELAVHADREKVQQVLLNLLANATRFTPPGGRIEVIGERGPDSVRLHVRDTGPGIPEDQQERVFEPFVQLGRSRSSPGEGSGLGLAISRDLARGMDGDLTVTSTVGVGTCFTLELKPVRDSGD